MARTESVMIPLGTIAPDFNLPDTVSGRNISLQEMKSEKATVIMFLCNHCPFVKLVNTALVDLANDYLPEGISFVAISSNDVENYPEDSPKNMKMVAEKLAYPFPYLYDETQDVAKAYQAVCTPDFMIFDKDLKCIYRGQLDDARPGNTIPPSGKDIREVMDAILKQEAIPELQKPSIGCNIKWKS